MRARLKARVKDPDSYAFFLSGPNDDDKPLAIDDDGQIVANAMLWVPKYGPLYYYTVKARVTRSQRALSARILSIAYRGMQKE